MKRYAKRQLTLGDLIRTVSRFARNDHEVGVVVADLICRGIVRPSQNHRSQRIHN